MGDLVTRFGGKISGELIRAEDWNGLIGGIEEQLTALETRVNGRIAALEPRLAAAEAGLAAIGPRLAPLEALAASLRARQRRIDLSSTRTSFAIGERAEIVARVTDLLGAPLDLSNPATRPWIDFVTVWGTLKAAPGFTSLVGTGGRTVTVQVNGSGEARVLLRAAPGEDFAEEQELEVAGVLATMVGAKNVAAAFLDAPTPASSGLAPAYAAVTAAYQRKDTPIMRNYMDATYLAKPVRAYTPLAPAFVINWRDEYATVLAFMKPDDNPGTADGAMAVGSIRITFRDWVYPWILTQFLPPKPDIVGPYQTQFAQHASKKMEAAVTAIWGVIENRTKDIGILGSQREFLAAQAALNTMTVVNPPGHLAGVVQTVSNGLAIQSSLVYGQAVAPMVMEDLTPARGVSHASVVGQSAVASAFEEAKADTIKVVAAAESRIMDNVRAENARMSNELLKEDGPVKRAENIAQTMKIQVETMSRELGKKAGIDMVGQLLNARNRPG